jgi:hypothetical protein
LVSSRRKSAKSPAAPEARSVALREAADRVAKRLSLVAGRGLRVPTRLPGSPVREPNATGQVAF